MIRKATAFATETAPVRCAVYTRKSTDEGLDQAFNSLDAQREAGEAFVLSRKAEGWVCLQDRYDDGGYSGGNIERPALKRLMVDIEAGRVDAVVCYKVDRLSRSLLDFSRLIEVFDRRKVMFVSVTQPINTADSSGRLMLNVLLSFAQFEREMIADRTRDKMSAARRKGKWTGGHPPLGYRVHDEGRRLVVDEDEAEMLREIFALYLDRRSLILVAEELNRRGWVTKRVGALGGQPWSKTRVHQVLTNATCTGRVEHRGQIYPGEHDAILDVETFDRVQELLAGNSVKGGARAKNRYGHLLRGLLHCTACGCAMSPSVTRKKGKVFRYYVCNRATKHGWRTCPHPSLRANDIEAAVVERIKCIGRDPSLLQDTLAEIRSIQKTRIPALTAERRRLERELPRLRDLEDADRLGVVAARIAEIDAELSFLQDTTVDRRDLSRALALFDEVWACLFPREQERVIQVLVERIEFDAAKESVAITFRPTGIRALAEEIAEAQEVLG